ncbi:MAG TPA: hypothetical protein VFR85_15140 [Anaeromyxobacteraceae bacterium]|nr:hypothetical protein [Anaeromyxobacteraceae bacterium]
MRNLLAGLVQALSRRLLGISAEEIRYTFEDVRAEIRATRQELKGEIADLRRDMLAAAPGGADKPKEPETPAAEA